MCLDATERTGGGGAGGVQWVGEPSCDYRDNSTMVGVRRGMEMVGMKEGGG